MLRADADIDIELMMLGERIEVALAIRDQPEPEPMLAERGESRERIVVEKEILVPLPLVDDVGPRSPSR